jgi:phosphoribosylamine--glycine ligase
MIENGKPRVLEFNARMGDPETQPLLMQLESDLVPLLLAIAEGKIEDDIELRWGQGASVCVVMASEGYPGKYEKGREIRGLEEASAMEDVQVFHAGTSLEGNKVVTSGGRVLGVTAAGRDIGEALRRAYEAVGRISWEGVHYRKDIGARALARGAG